MIPHELVEAAEREERIKRGLPADHVLDVAEFPFAFSRNAISEFSSAIKALRSQGPLSAEIAFNTAMAALAIRDYAQANLAMDEAQNLEPDNNRFRMRFGHTPNQSGETLPCVSGKYPTKPGFFFSCDAMYFSLFCLPLLHSIAQFSPNVGCHVHLLDAPDTLHLEASKLPLRLSFTMEKTELSNAPREKQQAYYNFIRLIRFAEALQSNPGPLWMADVDALVTTDIRFMLQSRGSMAMRIRPGRIQPWNQTSACLLMGTTSSLPFYRRVADVLKSDAGNIWWGIDQYALFTALISERPAVSLLGPDMAAVTPEVPGVFWFTAGGSKGRLMQATTPYALLYQKHVQSVLALLKP